MKRNLNWLLCVIFAFGWLVLFANEAVSKEIAIITCYGSGEVAFIDIEKAKVLKTIKLKDQASLPIDVAITPDGETAVVTCNTGYICFIDVKKMKCRKTLKLLSGPEQYGISLQPNEFSHVCITSNGKTAIVTEQNELGQIFKFDIETMALLGEPFYLGDEPGRIIINSNTSPHEFYVLDNGSIHILKKGSLPYFVPTPAGNDEIDDFALTPDGSRVIFVDSDNWIYLISTTSWNILDQEKVNEDRFTEPSQVAVSPDGTLAIITNETDQSITFVTVGMGGITIEQTIDVGGSPHGVAFTQDGQTAVVALFTNSLIKIIDVSQRQVKATVSKKLGLAPNEVVILDIPYGN